VSRHSALRFLSGLSLTAFFGGACSAERLVQVMETPPSVKTYVDLDSVKIDGDIRTAKEITKFASIAEAWMPVSMETVLEFNCRLATGRSLSTVTRFRNGQSQVTAESAEIFKVERNGSLAELKFRLICRSDPR